MTQWCENCGLVVECPECGNRINYKSLLARYIGWIGECEGIDYLEGIEPADFTEEEITELRNLSMSK